MSDIDWSKAPEGATHYDTRVDVYPWLKADDNGNKFWHVDMWVNYANDIGVNDSIFAKPGFFNCTVITSTKCHGYTLESSKEAKPVYTRSMADKGILPSVGMECMVLNNGLDVPEYEKCRILFIGTFRVVYNSASCTERVGRVGCDSDTEFKPIDNRTDEEKAIEDLINARKTCNVDENSKNILDAIKAGKIHNVTWSK